MIIKSSKKKDDQVSIKIESVDGTINVLQRKQKIIHLYRNCAKQWYYI